MQRAFAALPGHPSNAIDTYFVSPLPLGLELVALQPEKGSCVNHHGDDSSSPVSWSRSASFDSAASWRLALDGDSGSEDNTPVAFPVPATFSQLPPGVPSLLGHPATLPSAVPSHLPRDALLQLLRRYKEDQEREAKVAEAPVVEEEVLVGIQGQYQPYCTQVITEGINACTQKLLQRLKLLRMHDEEVAALQGSKASKRFLCSLKEVCKKLEAAQLLIVAPDIKPSPLASANPMRLLHQVLLGARARGVPVVFALSRRGIGQAFGPDKRISVLAVTQTRGCEDEIGTLLERSVEGVRLHEACFAFVRASGPKA